MQARENNNSECLICAKTCTNLHSVDAPIKHGNSETTALNKIRMIVERDDITRHGSYLCSVCFSLLKNYFVFERKICAIKKRIQRLFTLAERKLSRNKDDENVNNSPETKAKPFPCKICGKEFSAFSHRVEHYLVHWKEKPFQCKYCTACFSSQSNAKKHELKHGDKKPFQCTQCQKSYTEKASLKEHLRVHSGEKPYKCEQCGKQFHRRKDHVVHLKVHGNTKDFKCSTCGKEFALKYRLERHNKIHSGAKYLCKVCKKAFSRKEDRNKHMEIHTDEISYTCSACSMSFPDNSSFQLHLKIHEPNQHACSFCSQTFTKESSLKQHLRRKHKNMNEGTASMMSENSQQDLSEKTRSISFGQMSRRHPEDSEVVEGMYNASFQNERWNSHNEQVGRFDNKVGGPHNKPSCKEINSDNNRLTGSLESRFNEDRSRMVVDPSIRVNSDMVPNVLNSSLMLPPFLGPFIPQNPAPLRGDQPPAQMLPIVDRNSALQPAPGDVRWMHSIYNSLENKPIT